MVATPDSALAEYFRDRTEVVAAYVFGSVARGTAGKLSDIDIAVLLDGAEPEQTSPYGYRAELTADLQALLGTNDVDLVVLDSAPPLLQHRVLRHGRLIYCRDETRRVRFTIHAIQQYLDTAALRRIQTTYLNRRLAAGRFAAGRSENGG
jgi:predicted nucleotidyltransferase